MTGLLYGCLTALGLYLAILLLKCGLAICVIRREPNDAATIAAGQVTVLQPILGGDPRLAETLAATLANTSGGTRFLWLVDQDDAAGRAATDAAVGRHSDRVDVVWCEPPPESVNPKVYKLEKAWPRVATPFFAVLDDDTTISDHNLRVALGALAECDLYTGLPGYASVGSAWESLVTHFVNNNSIMTYLSMLPLTGPLSINGMFYVARTATFQAIGGFSSIRACLCDDYAVARLLLDHGRCIHQGTAVQVLKTSIAGPGHYARIMHRWFLFAGFLVRDQRFAVRLLLLVLLGLPALLLWVGLIGACWLTLAVWLGHVNASTATVAMAALGAVLMARHGVIRYLHGKLFEQRLPFRPMVSIVSELLQPLHWLHSVLESEIRWRTRRIRVRRDNTFRMEDA